MLKKLSSTVEYIDFAAGINSDPRFSVPAYSSAEELNQSLLKAPEQPNKLVLGCFEGGELLGLFVFLVEEQEKYLEMLMPLSRSAPAYEELFGSLRERYPGWQCDFVYNPGNHLPNIGTAIPPSTPPTCTGRLSGSFRPRSASASFLPLRTGRWWVT